MVLFLKTVAFFGWPPKAWPRHALGSRSRSQGSPTSFLQHGRSRVILTSKIYLNLEKLPKGLPPRIHTIDPISNTIDNIKINEANRTVVAYVQSEKNLNCCGSFVLLVVRLKKLMLVRWDPPNMSEFFLTYTVPANGGPHSGSAIYVRQIVTTSSVTLNTVLQATAVCLYFGQRLYTVCSV